MQLALSQLPANTERLLITSTLCAVPIYSTVLLAQKDGQAEFT